MKKNAKTSQAKSKTKPVNEAKFKTKIAVHPKFAGTHFIEVPKKIVDAFASGFRIRLHCTVNGSLKFQCGFMALGNGRAYITITKARLKSLGARDGDAISVHLKRDTSKYGMKMCEELKEVLKQDEEAAARFAALKPGKQRNIIHFVGSIINSDKRIERALLMINNLKNLPKGREDMRGLLGLPPREDIGAGRYQKKDSLE